MGWTNLKEAAVACGQPVSSWRSWEAGTAQPRRMVEVCQAISARTGADLGWLLGLGRPGAPPPVLPSEPNNDTYRSLVRRIAEAQRAAKDQGAAAARAA